MKTRLRFFVGVDGGGSKCRVRIRAASGQDVSYAEGGASNIHSDPETAFKTISETIGVAFARASLSSEHYAASALGLGLAGVLSSQQERPDDARLSAFARVTITSDAETACLGAHQGADGGIVIAGTGSAAFATRKGKRIAIGGRGFAIADDGSAARLGWQAVRHAVNAADGLGLTSPMTQKLMQGFQNDPVAVTRWAKLASPSDYGHWAPLVFGFAAKGDPVAIALVKEAVAAIVALRDALAVQGIERIALVGGMREAVLPWIALDQPEAFVSPLRDAADGAILLAGGKVS